jgi:hypothetical protein
MFDSSLVVRHRSSRCRLAHAQHLVLPRQPRPSPASRRVSSRTDARAREAIFDSGRHVGCRASRAEEGQRHGRDSNRACPRHCGTSGRVRRLAQRHPFSPILTPVFRVCFGENSCFCARRPAIALSVQAVQAVQATQGCRLTLLLFSCHGLFPTPCHTTSPYHTRPPRE